ncbi:MAG: FAD-binding protein [Ruminococcus sp.]|nr:FAD-binding protein [Ruminococcus sp.]
MIRISNLKIPVSHTEEELESKAAAVLHVKKEDIQSWHIVKKSTDARRKPDIYFIYTIDVKLKSDNEKTVLHHVRSKTTVQISEANDIPYVFPVTGSLQAAKRPVIIGSGPAGLFCAYFLAACGLRPIVLERGKDVETRHKDVETFWKSGLLKTDSNVQFGEGGAGTFSDGKLNTLIKDRNGRNKEVLRIFVQAGAPEEILYEARPHIGTDLLRKVVRNIRENIIQNGGEVRFESKVTDIVLENDRIREVIINDSQRLPADIVVLAIGHSARDTFRMLYEHHIPMDAKPFAVGLRVEHPRRMINRIQYGREQSPYLHTADYKLTAQTADGRGVYSFCMCPGGYVVNASSEEGRLAINGMSYHGRDGDNSNSAIIVTVTPADFADAHPLAGIAFQRDLEERAYRIGNGRVPVETYGDYKKALTGEQSAPSMIRRDYADFGPAIKGAYAYGDVHTLLPKTLGRSFIEGMEQFGRILPGFADSAVYLSGIESRTSSPVKIPRAENGESSIAGLYPCGEGAGYAGGITSAAMDGILTAEKVAQKIAAGQGKMA